MELYLEYHEGTSNKFYRMRLAGTSVTVEHGAIGKAPQYRRRGLE